MMLCPACSVTLSESSQGMLMCPTGHGILITGRFLSDIEDAPSIPEKSIQAVGDTKHAVTCPHCAAVMHKVDYNHTGIVIDSCAECHYRWLDAGEYQKIKDHKPQLNPEDAALLLSIEKQIGNVITRKDPNPAFRLDSRATFRSPAALGFTAMHVIIKAMLHSRFLRIVTVIILIFTALIYYYVLQEFAKT